MSILVADKLEEQHPPFHPTFNPPFMKKRSILLLLLTVSLELFSQDDHLPVVFDSIIAEADLLYRYEKAVWHSTDLLLTDKTLKKDYGGYVVSHSEDTVFVTYLDKRQEMSIARYAYFSTFFDFPIAVNKEKRPLTPLEQALITTKLKIISLLGDSQYNVTIPTGYNPNFVLIKDSDAYRMYILMGTPNKGVIPFGNDYLFKTDLNGSLLAWKKFHSRMIPAYSKGPNGAKVTAITHSHLKTTPYITATDICTFRLYGPLCGLDAFSVLCTSTGKYYTYKLKTNYIEVTTP